jgi:hypothetical protein
VQRSDTVRAKLPPPLNGEPSRRRIYVERLPEKFGAQERGAGRKENQCETSHRFSSRILVAKRSLAR